MDIKFLGAAGMVTGSAFLLNDNGEKILIDLGMFQGAREISELNYKELALDPKSLKAVILSHAHLDHCGRLPLLTRAGFRGNIYMTEATRVLTEITLLDAAKIAADNKKRAPLYREQDVRDLLRLAKAIKYHEVLDLGNFKVKLFDAGHILGSASIEIEVGNRKIVFSADLGNTPEPIVKPTEYLSEAEIVVMESTYGGRVHSKESAEEILKKEINTIESFGGTLLIPAFSIERTQVLLHLIDHLKKANSVKEQTPVFLDSPMAIKATYAYDDYPDLYNSELQEHLKKDAPFDFPNLVLVDKVKDQVQIEATAGPKVIIAGSGMMNGGRILNHAINFLPFETTRLLFVGFQAEGTLGRHILEGQRQVRIKGHDVKVNAKVREITSLSSHADEPQLLDWLSKIKGVKKVFLIHGEDTARQAIKPKIQNLGIADIVMPVLDQEETI